MGQARTDGLDLAGVLPLFRRQSHTTGHDDDGQITRPSQRHQDRRQALVTGPDTEHATPRRQGADQASHDDGGIVAIGQRIEHACRALCAAVTRIGAISGKRNRPEATDLVGGGLHEQADLPVTSVVTQGDRCAIRRPDAPHRAEDEELFATQMRWIPPHPRILTEAEDVATRRLDDGCLVEGELAGWARRLRADRVDGIVGAEDLVEVRHSVDPNQGDSIGGAHRETSPSSHRSARVKMK